MAQSSIMKCRGLHTFANNLSELPVGALVEAENVVVDRDGVIGPRRGFSLFGTSMGPGNIAYQLLTYKGRVLRHYGSRLEYDSDGSGTFAAFNDQSGSVASVVEAESGLRIKALEANGNYYFTTSQGIKKLSAASVAGLSSAVVSPAGGAKATDIELTLNAQAGFLPTTHTVGYRVVWGIKDQNNNLILGTPSPLTIIRNSTAADRTVNVFINIPQDITENHFVQIYRTPTTASEDPGDDLNLVYEANPTAAELTDRHMRVHDIVPDDFREGATLLYTNKNSGEGILQANERPPLAEDVATFRNSTFYANTQTPYRLNLSLLGVQELTSGVSTFVVTDGTTTNTYTFTAPQQEATEIVCTSAATLSGKYFLINSARNKTQYYVWYNVDGASVDPALAGKVGIPVSVASADTDAAVATATKNALDEATSAYTLAFTATVSTNTVMVGSLYSGATINASAGTSGFTVTTILEGAGEDAANKKVLLENTAALTPSQQVDDTARSLVRVINKDPAGLVYAFYLSGGPEDISGKILLESRQLGGARFYVKADSVATGGQFNPTLPTANTLGADNEVAPNRIHYSKTQQPEAVPLLNFVDIGARDKHILRILGLRDSLFIFKQDGIFRLSGDSPQNFQVTLLDSSADLLAPDTATVLNNQIYCFTTQGVSTVSDTGVSVISRPIENLLLPLTTYSHFEKSAFAVGYESDRSYLMWTVKQASDTVATQCFRYNTFTNTWTILTLSKSCAVVVNDVLYLGATDTPYIEKERKSFTRLDYADRDFAHSVPTNSMEDVTVSFGDLLGIVAGDVLVQTQYLTIAQFNRLLKKLDSDSGLTATDYFSSLQATPSASLADRLTALVNKLNAAGSGAALVYTSSGSNTFSTLQSDFNAVIDQLNADTGVSFFDYKRSNGTIEWEVPVDSVVTSSQQAVLAYSVPLIRGPITVYKSIRSKVTWAPHHAGDATILKHFQEGTILFENNAFTKATAAYASDLSTGFDSIAFTGEGTGIWGGASWGRCTWGGHGTSRPFRTYIPREKQRARFLSCRFTHAAAFENYAIFGISFTFEQNSTRGYR